VSLLLDTNVCISVLSASSEPSRRRYEQLLIDGDPILVPSVVVFDSGWA
jgi:predicted nucleic acid-binding protein